MTKEDTQQLLKDICARIPYGIKASIRYCDLQDDEKIKYRDIDITYSNIEQVVNNWSECKPYLRLMSSMTEEERLELSRLTDDKFKFYLYTLEPEIICYEKYNYLEGLKVLDWLLAHHFDYRGLITRGLALEAPKDMYKTE